MERTNVNNSNYAVIFYDNKDKTTRTVFLDKLPNLADLYYNSGISESVFIVSGNRLYTICRGCGMRFKLQPLKPFEVAMFFNPAKN